jgi:general secretion pathway protein J
MTRQRGLTLPELLVALLIFSMVATATVFALRLGVEARDQLGEAEGRLAELQIANVLIKEDMAQIRMRQTRDEFGDNAGPAFRGGDEWRPRNEEDDERTFLTFVRAGWNNPGAGAPRSELQYVEYLEKDGALVRRVRPFLDDARGQPRFDRTLIRDARDLKLEFLVGESRLNAGELEWSNAWPLSQNASGGAPKAMRLSLTTERYGLIEQAFWIGQVVSPGAPQ